MKRIKDPLIKIFNLVKDYITDPVIEDKKIQKEEQKLIKQYNPKADQDADDLRQ